MAIFVITHFYLVYQPLQEIWWLPSSKLHVNNLLLNSGRILYMKFDESRPVDSSGVGNHGIGQISGHSGFGGVGTSAYFRNNFIHVKSSDLKTAEFTYMFYIYILSDEKSHQNGLKYDQYCPVIHKGYKTDLANEATPEISVNPNLTGLPTTQSLKCNYKQFTELTSNSRLQKHHWYHIALVREKYDILLFVDALTRINPLPLYIGSTPFSVNCDFPFLMDELSIFSQAVGTDEIQAEASFALGGIESSYVTIGCTNCSKEEAMASCPDGYHLCNKFELYTGTHVLHRLTSIVNSSTQDINNKLAGYKVARKLSLASSDIMASASAEPSSGIGLCCTNLNY
ncbi:uncharacterized protein TOT_040000732 [Theileria orientalis strain Shintoku]|uniref:DUF8019 domain-containing protein n=1 Tax=Theileria orientalis strain Shintoku TaxID=869250 RepID=J7M4P1_THEOR|nr:uncharacterized protein TOT_040000732 [Theileria orientalis strain Shintoku]BAM42365.1 uncharacterized protein TOT_040000732 [Theileria orientalis strain Shintoku]|eukprot:XP_009692666.1 uncharacterized protein TOT_040000732 [Theileria orientalis strain Shintoku]